MSADLLSLKITAAIAMFSCFIIIMTVIKYKLHQSISYKLILYQNLALLAENAACLLPNSNGVSCYLQAIISEYAGVSSVFWACTISFVLFKVTSPYYYLTYKPDNEFLYFCLFAFLTPFLICIIPVFFDVYGKTDSGWCWITDDTTFGMIFVRYVTQIINWGSIAFIILTNLMIYYNLYSLKVGSNSSLQFSKTSPTHVLVVKILVLYPLILVFCYLPISLPPIWIQSFASVDQYYLITAVILRTRGILNLLYFSFHDRVYKRYLHEISTCFPCLPILITPPNSLNDTKVQPSTTSPLANYQMNSRPSFTSSGGFSVHEIGCVLHTTSSTIATDVVEV